ncbi:MAG: hypothetical protein LBR35_02020 [Rickettsiales bacterium]|jgi:uncharacterized membrane protein|nr:hypothetical protein [Rickettsiales bacterium]
MKKILFLLLSFVTIGTVAQNFGPATSSSYYCTLDTIQTSTTLSLQQIFSILANIYNKYAIWVFLALLIPAIWAFTKAYIDKEIKWQDLNKYAWHFGTLIGIGLLVNLLAAPQESFTHGSDSGLYTDIRVANSRLIKCSKDSEGSVYIQRNFIKKIN